MSRLDKHKAAHKAAMSRKKVQSNPLEDIMRPQEAANPHPSDVPPLFRCSRCGCPKASHSDRPAWPNACQDCECTQYEGSAPSPVGASRPLDHPDLSADEVNAGVAVALEERRRSKQSGQSPAVRDERMRRKGRFPTATELHAKYHADLGGAGMWLVEATVWTDQTGPSDGNAGKTFSQSGPGIHGAIENLWDQYCRWRDEQTEAAK